MSSLRPKNPKKLSFADLQPGDVILSGGNDWIDTLVKYLDQGDYSHCTQYIGLSPTGDHMCVEAIPQGVLYHSFVTGKDSDWNIQNLIDVYRFKSDDGHVLGDPGWPVDPLLTTAKSFVGGKYAFSDLILVGLMLLTVEYTEDTRTKELVRILLAEVSGQITHWLNENKNKIPMICTQVITSGHWLAPTSPPHKYGLQVKVDGQRKIPWKGDMVDLSGLSPDMQNYHKVREEAKLILERLGLLSDTAPVPLSHYYYAGSPELPLGTCTPRDMETSPNLEFIGCLKDTRPKS